MKMETWLGSQTMTVEGDISLGRVFTLRIEEIARTMDGRHLTFSLQLGYERADGMISAQQRMLEIDVKGLNHVALTLEALKQFEDVLYEERENQT